MEDNYSKYSYSIGDYYEKNYWVRVPSQSGHYEDYTREPVHQAEETESMLYGRSYSGSHQGFLQPGELMSPTGIYSTLTLQHHPLQQPYHQQPTTSYLTTPHQLQIPLSSPHQYHTQYNQNQSKSCLLDKSKFLKDISSPDEVPQEEYNDKEQKHFLPNETLQKQLLQPPNTVPTKKNNEYKVERVKKYTRKQTSDTISEEEKKAQRRLKNKLAAARCRQKRVDHINYLTKVAERLEGEVEQLTRVLRGLERENTELETILRIHGECSKARLQSLCGEVTEELGVFSEGGKSREVCIRKEN